MLNLTTPKSEGSELENIKLEQHLKSVNVYVQQRQFAEVFIFLMNNPFLSRIPSGQIQFH